MLSLSEVKVGAKVELDGAPCEVIWREHSKIGRAGAVLRTKIRDLRTGNILSRTFQGNETLPEANISSIKAQYLYTAGGDYYFMDEENYDQFSLSQKQLGNAVNFLVEGTRINIWVYQEIPINVDLPIKMDLKVEEAPPGIKGNTADGGTKQVKLETGYKLNVPLFIKKGDVIRVNTKEGTYVERA
ncbi:MAG: elongation factor P [Candidatus Moranbacteria bacterium]|nr:elongation factor P [Candidatus Moranbacteria bacterium]